MSQYGIGMTFCNIEWEVLQKAIAHYSNLCKREIKNGKHVPFRAHSITIKRIRAEVGKATKGPLKVLLLAPERHALEAALKSYVDAVEREIATGVNKPFRADIELAKVICDAIDVELWRAILTDELRQERRKGRSAMRD
jgi:hypothetical protein